jgi:ADP-heptose:LPS heptosyltransferase
MEIFVIRAGALGDAVLTLPFFHALRKRFSDCKISVIGSYPLLELLRGSPLADYLFRIDDAQFTGFFSNGAVSDEWKRRIHSASIVYLLMEDSVLFRNISHLCPGEVSMVSGIEKKGHAGERILSVLSGDGSGSIEYRPDAYLSEEDEDFGEEFLGNNGLKGEKTVVIHPGSGSKGKNWPAERFACAGKKLASYFGMKTLVSGGEADREAVSEFMDNFGEGAVFAGELSIRRLAAVIKRCRMYIGNDSGVSHLAAVLGVTTICVFGPTDPDVWAPRGREVFIVRKKTECSPCSRERRNSCANRKCLLGIETDDVLKMADSIL